MIRTLLFRNASLLAFVLLIVLWELACRIFRIPAYLLPSPWNILKGFTTLSPERWLIHIWSTLSVAICGFICAIVIAIPLAMGINRSELASRIIMPWLIVIQSTPIIAIAPIIVVVLGAGMAPRIVITTMISFFPIVISTATGLAAVPDEFIDLSRSLRASRWREYSQIRLPYAMPYIFSSLRIAITLSIVGAVVSEFVAAETGLGYLILYSTSSFQIDVAFAALILLIVCSLVLYTVIGWIQRFLFPWSSIRH